MVKMRFSNFQNNENGVMIERDVIFHATSGANDVINVDVEQLLHFTTIIKFEICYYMYFTNRHN